MTLLIWKERLIGAASTLLIVGACAHALGAKKPPRDIKIYSHQPTAAYCDKPWCTGRVGFVRKQAEEVVDYAAAEGWLAVSPEDFGRLIATCPQ